MDVLVGSHDWLDSPCSRCRLTPCCKHLPIHEFSIRRRADFRMAEELLNFPHICIGLKDTGRWTIYWRRTCRHYATDTGKCGVHDSPLQSLICRQYSPYGCWYKKAFAEDITLQMIMFDSIRLAALSELITWTASGELDTVPAWEEMTDVFSKARTFRVTAKTGDSPFPAVLVPPGRIGKRADLELLRFRLGFPGVSLVVTDSEWAFLLTNESIVNAARVTESGILGGTGGLAAVLTGAFDPFGLAPDLLTARLVEYDTLQEFIDSCRFIGDTFMDTIYHTTGHIEAGYPCPTGSHRDGLHGILSTEGEACNEIVRDVGNQSTHMDRGTGGTGDRCCSVHASRVPPAQGRNHPGGTRHLRSGIL